MVDLNGELRELGIAPLNIEKILATSLRNGGTLAELFFEESVVSRILFEGGKVDRVIQGMDRGVGLRIIFGGRSVYGYTTDLNDTALLALAETLVEAVPLDSSEKKAVRPVPEWRLSLQPCSEIQDYQIQRSPQAVSLEEKVKLVKRGEKAARGEYQSARQVSSVLADSFRKILVLNSDGLVARDQKTYTQMVVQVVGEKEGRVESAYESKGGFVGMEFFDSTPPEEIGTAAAKRVKILLEAKPAPSGSMPVVIAAEAGGTMIHEAVGHGLEADLACEGLSVYHGKLDQKVAASSITVLDDGTMPGKRGSYRFDDEGNPSKKNTLIENGVLKSYLVDRLSALKFDLMATGNGRRQSFRHKPIVRMTNTYIAPGKDDPEEILSSTPWGIFVKAMGGGEVNTVTGDFVFAVTEGYLIRGGRLESPIRGATLVGNGPIVLSLVDRVGTDLGFSTGTCGKDGQEAPVTDAQPTLRIPELTVGGEVSIEEYWPKKG